jgi:hypothetical protein
VATTTITKPTFCRAAKFPSQLPLLRDGGDGQPHGDTCDAYVKFRHRHARANVSPSQGTPTSCVEARPTGMPASATSLRLKVSLFKRQFHLFACDFRMIGQHSRKRRRSSSGLFFAVGDFHKPSEKIDQEGGVPCVIG